MRKTLGLNSKVDLKSLKLKIKREKILKKSKLIFMNILFKFWIILEIWKNKEKIKI